MNRDLIPLTELRDRATEARRLALVGIHAAGSGHPGGSLSCIDLLTVLYARMRFDLLDPQWIERDRFILSKGHAAPALYAVGACAGLIDKRQLRNLRKLGSPLQGHPHVGVLPWVETSTGSLGQGFSAALGMALGLRHQRSDARVYALLGDGEMQEGEVWEALMSAAHFGLDRLCAILDYNKLQSDSRNSLIMNFEPLGDKLRSFGWHVIEINGHDLAAIDEAFSSAEHHKTQPSFIIAHTVKGAGVDYMAHKPEWHGSVKLSDIDLSRALAALGVTEHDIASYFYG